MRGGIAWIIRLQTQAMYINSVYYVRLKVGVNPASEPEEQCNLEIRHTRRGLQFLQAILTACFMHKNVAQIAAIFTLATMVIGAQTDRPTDGKLKRSINCSDGSYGISKNHEVNSSIFRQCPSGL